MFNVTKALKKLDEIGTHDVIKTYSTASPDVCEFSPERRVTMPVLREIILAGHEDGVDEKITHKNMWDRMDAIVRTDERIEDEFRGRFSDFYGRFKALEERLAILEKRYELERLDNAEERISRLEELLTAMDIEINGKRWFKSPEKPVTEQDCQDDYDQPHKLFKDDKPSECTHVNIIEYRDGTRECAVCHQKWHDKPSLKEAISECMDEIGIEAVKASKPSEFISRDTIYCAVSAGLEKYRTTWAKENRGVRDCVTDTVMDTIKKQLG